jgi:nicotinate-nucleotide--dimethylbenzimidazole phosphoribosyltransferase
VTRGELLERTTASIPSPDLDVAAETARLLDAKTKPPGSLGRLEDLACRISAIRGSVPSSPLEPAIVVAAADHGVAARGVSAYPQAVTAQMLANFAGGGAAICVLAREAGARLVVVDAGVIGAPPDIDGIRPEIVDGVRGTEDLTLGPAMSRSTAIGLIERGIALADELASEGIGVVGLGEMGIGNTTSASALAAALLRADPSAVCGPGTGIDHDGLSRKVEAVSLGLAMLEPNPDPDPIDVLAALGGLEIAFLAGVTLGASARRIPVLLDGFITTAAALVASRIRPAVAGSLIAATRSPEPGHEPVLAALGIDPLLDLRLRLGEGTGAALALPLIRGAIAVLTDMATFDDAGVSGPADPTPAVADA